MKQRLYILLIAIFTCVNVVWGQDTYNVVYIKSGGSGTAGTKEAPVGTWANAYKKLINTGNRDYDWEHNIIVIVAGSNITPNFTETDTYDQNGTLGTPATITGVWPWDSSDNATTEAIKKGGQLRINSTNHSIGSDTRFRNLWIYGGNNSQNRMSLRMHSTLFDTGLVMQNFAKMEPNYGAIAGRDAPNLHIQLTRDQTNTAGANEYRMPNNKPIEVTFKSGRYGRIAVSRTAGSDPKNYYIQGTPNNPVMAHVTVDIQPGNDNTGGYADDISILMGGSSQGIVCADLQYDIKHGTIGTLVAGTQGNNIISCINNKIPAATFAGRTKVNVGQEDGSDTDVTIQSYFGGTQGRAQTTQTTNASSYFYGESELNMYSGTIKAGVFASATAFSGVGNASNHTPDYAIPYVNSKNELTFSSYSSTGKMAVIKSTYHNGQLGYVEGQDDIDLSATKLTFNIRGGVIEGGLYGGSKGYEPQIAVGNAPAGAGTHYGDTFVNIYGGTIKGGVHGGGLGTKEYYNAATTEAQRNGFLNVAQVYGNTHVNIYGGDIQGDIYGGGYGILTDKNEYLPIAKVFGTTYVTINPTNPSWTFNHNIYGGGALGSVEGNTNVTILGGIINGNVFGAGKGEDGHPNKAKVTGSTNVTIGKQPVAQQP